LIDILGLLNSVASLYMSYASLVVTRFIYGILVGLNSALDPQYVNHVSPSNYSGIFGTLCNVALLLGLTVAFILSWVLLV
jgi:MFS family permease